MGLNLVSHKSVREEECHLELGRPTLGRDRWHQWAPGCGNGNWELGNREIGLRGRGENERLFAARILDLDPIPHGSVVGMAGMNMTVITYCKICDVYITALGYCNLPDGTEGSSMQVSCLSAIRCVQFIAQKRG